MSLHPCGLTRLVCSVLLAGLFSIHAYAGGPPVITSVAWSPEGRYLAAGNDHGLITTWDVDTGRTAWTWQGTKYGIHKLFFDSRRHGFLVLEQSGDVVILDPPSGKIMLRLALEFGERDRNFVAGLAHAGFDDDSEVLAVSGSLKPQVHVLDLKKIPSVPATQTAKLGAMILWEHPPAAKDSDQTSPVASFKREDQTPAEIAEFGVGTTNEDQLADLSVCHGGTRVVGITKAGWLRGWDLTLKPSEQAIYQRRVVNDPERYYLLDITCGPGDRAVTTGATEKYGTIQLWDSAKGTLIDSLDSGAASLIAAASSFSSDGKLVATNGDLSYLLWRVDAGKLHRYARMRKGNQDVPMSVQQNIAFAPNSHSLAIADGFAVLIINPDTLTSRCVSGGCGTLQFQSYPVESAAP